MRGQLAEVRRLADVRPLDRLSSIRVKLGSITVLAVLVTIGTLYVLIGFALRNSEREVALRQSLGSARDLSAQAFDAVGHRTASLPEVAARAGRFVLVVDAAGNVLQASMPVPGTVARALAGSVDTGFVDGLEYVDVEQAGKRFRPPHRPGAFVVLARDGSANFLIVEIGDLAPGARDSDRLELHSRARFEVDAASDGAWQALTHGHRAVPAH